MDIILWVMKEAGTPNVPSLSTLRRHQKAVDAEIAPTLRASTSGLKNELCSTDLGSLISRVRGKHYSVDVPLRVPADTFYRIFPTRLFVPI